MVWQNQERSDKTNSVIAAFICKPQTHGIIHRQPANLFELQHTLPGCGFRSGSAIKETIRNWILNKTNADILDAKLVLLIYLPKMRHVTGKIETTEVRAFLTLGKVREIGEALGLLERIGNMSGMLIGQTNQSWEALKAIQIGIMQVHDMLTPKLAALMNGYAPCENRIVGIGTGALGPQVFNNLLRSGYGKWTLIDDDVLLPHNCARHFLGDWAVGKTRRKQWRKLETPFLAIQLSLVLFPAIFSRPKHIKVE